MLSKILYNYPQFYRVGLSFNFMYSKKKELEELLCIQEYADFWGEDVNMPPTKDLILSRCVSRVDESS